MIQRSLLFIAIISSLPSIAVINEAQLMSIAENQGYGYKFANLVMLDEAIREFHDTHASKYRVAVPEFYGITSKMVQAFAVNNLGLDIEKNWAALINKYFANTTSDDLFARGQFPDGFVEESTKFAARIRQAFTDSVVRQFDDSELLTPAVLKMIDDVKRLNERLMVRSSGKEDTKMLANAGGNESIANVDPSINEIVMRIGEVVASYFETRSLTQRLAARDPALLEKLPFTPVIIQRMIGEQSVHALPKCGVMFTEEAEGGISNTYPNRTSGITLIQTAYGHNEAVVNSRIPVDSYYVDAHLNIFPIVGVKTHRMKPGLQSGKLDLVKNSPNVIEKSALSRNEVIALKHFANILEAYYRWPMDVEYVVNSDERIIYIVQARPIVHKRDLPPPSYLRTRDKFPSADRIDGEAIGVAGGSLRFITNTNDVIIARTINDALMIYQDKKIVPYPQKIQAIIIGKEAPRTSHEATSFRSDGKPVLFVKDLDKVQAWLQSANAKLLLSPQQSLLVNYRGDENSLEAIMQRKDIALSGWSNYPAPQKYSVIEDFLVDEQSLKSLLCGLSSKQTNEADLANHTVSELLDVLKHGDHANAETAAKLISRMFLTATDTAAKDVLLTDGKKTRIALFKLNLLSNLRSVFDSLNYQTDDPLHTRRLLPVRFLENLIMQAPVQTEIVRGISALSLLGTELMTEQNIMREFNNRKLDSRTVQYLRMRTLALTPELRNAWQNFVLRFHDAHVNSDVKERFENLIIKLHQIDLLPIWLHTSFAAAKHLVVPEHIAQQLIDEYEIEKEFLQQLFNKRAEINALSVDSFAQPKSFKPQWQIFNDSLVDYFVSKDFLSGFSRAQRLGKFSAITTMHNFVDRFDLSIKALTGSRMYKDDDKLRNFQTMLKKYVEPYNSWYDLLPEGTIQSRLSDSKEKLLGYILDAINKKNLSASDLLLTPGFNAPAFTIGSGVHIDLSFVEPTSLEDGFTVIHQSFLVVLTALNKLAGIDDIVRPSLLESSERAVLLLDKGVNSRASDNRASIIGMSLGHADMTLNYNFPLGAHSMQISLIFSKATGFVDVNVNFFGHNPDRWLSIGNLVRLLTSLKAVNAHDIQTQNSGVTFTLTVAHPSQVLAVQSVIQQAINLTFGNELDVDQLFADMPTTAIVASTNHIIDMSNPRTVIVNTWLIDLAFNHMNSDDGLPLVEQLISAHTDGLTKPSTVKKLLAMVDFVIKTGNETVLPAAINKLAAIWNVVRNDDDGKTAFSATVDKIAHFADTATSSPLKTRLAKIIEALTGKLAGQVVYPYVVHKRRDVHDETWYGHFHEFGSSLIKLTCPLDNDASCLIDIDRYNAIADVGLYFSLFAFVNKITVTNMRKDSDDHPVHYQILVDNGAKVTALTQLFMSTNGTFHTNNGRNFLDEQIKNPATIFSFIEHLIQITDPRVFVEDSIFRANALPLLLNFADGVPLLEKIIVNDNWAKIEPPFPQFMHNVGKSNDVYNNTMAFFDRITASSNRWLSLKLLAHLVSLDDKQRAADMIKTIIARTKLLDDMDVLLITFFNESDFTNKAHEEKYLNFLIELIDAQHDEPGRKFLAERILERGLYRLKYTLRSVINFDLALKLMRTLVDYRPSSVLLAQIMIEARYIMANRATKDLQDQLIDLAKQEPYAGDTDVQKELESILELRNRN